MSTKVNIDQRPRLMTFLGGIALMLGLLFAFQTLTKSSATLLGEVKLTHLHNTGKELNVFDYSGQCVKSARCLGAYWHAWAVPLYAKAVCLGAVAWGALLALFGAMWKPEVSLGRAIRMRAWRQFELPEKSSIEPAVKGGRS